MTDKLSEKAQTLLTTMARHISVTIEGVGTLLAWTEYWKLIYQDCESTSSTSRAIEDIKAEVRRHYATCSLLASGLRDHRSVALGDDDSPSRRR